MGVTNPFTITDMIGDKKDSDCRAVEVSSCDHRYAEYAPEPQTQSLPQLCRLRRELDYFLYPGLAPESDAGRAIVHTTVDMVHGFRDAGMKVLWVNVRLAESGAMNRQHSLTNFTVGPGRIRPLGYRTCVSRLVQR